MAFAEVEFIGNFIECEFWIEEVFFIDDEVLE